MWIVQPGDGSPDDGVPGDGRRATARRAGMALIRTTPVARLMVLACWVRMMGRGWVKGCG